MFDYAPKLRQAAYVSGRYKELEAQPAWSDFLSQIKHTRDALVTQILTPGGTVDKWGHPHEEEKKAVLVFIDTLLAHALSVHKRVEQLETIERQAEEQRNRAAYAPTGQIHDGDTMFDDVL